MNNHSHHVAVLGASPKPARYANQCVRLLKEHGYRVTPLHPRFDEVEDLPVTHSLAEIGDRIDMKRLHYTGRIPYEQLLDLLRVGRAHAYLTYPFVLSWSMVEAMSLGAHVVGSATPPVQPAQAQGRSGPRVE